MRQTNSEPVWISTNLPRLSFPHIVAYFRCRIQNRNLHKFAGLEFGMGLRWGFWDAEPASRPFQTGTLFAGVSAGREERQGRMRGCAWKKRMQWRKLHVVAVWHLASHIPTFESLWTLVCIGIGKWYHKAEPPSKV